MIGKMAIATALRGFNDRTFGDRYISFQKQILFTMIYTCPKMNKNEMKKKIFQDFSPRDIESCPLASANRMKQWSLNSNMFFKEPHQLTKFT